MVTKEQATAERAKTQENFTLYEHTEFHFGECCKEIGIRGGTKTRQVKVRRSGKTQTWKTRPNDFRIPVKFGLKESAEITEKTAFQFHTVDDCPLNKE